MQRRDMATLRYMAKMLNGDPHTRAHKVSGGGRAFLKPMSFA